MHLSIHQQAPTFSHGWPTVIHINGLQQLRHQSLKQWHVHEWQPWNDDLVTNKCQQQHFEMFVPCASRESGVMCHESELPGTVPWHSSIDLNQNGMSHGSCLFHIPLLRLRYHFCQFSLILNPYYFVGQGGKRGYKQPWMLSRTNTNAPHNLRFWLPWPRRDLPRPVIKHGKLGWLKSVSTPSSIDILKISSRCLPAWYSWKLYREYGKKRLTLTPSERYMLQKWNQPRDIYLNIPNIKNISKWHNIYM